MDVAFQGLIKKCVVVYFDDVTVYSKNREDHIQHSNPYFLKGVGNTVYPC
jgi:hypothetical protein